MPEVQPLETPPVESLVSPDEAASRTVTFIFRVNSRGKPVDLTVVSGGGALPSTIAVAENFVMQSLFPVYGRALDTAQMVRYSVDVGPLPVVLVTVVGISRDETANSSRRRDQQAVSVTSSDPSFSDAANLWRQLFTAQDFDAAFPRRAYRRRQSGQVDLFCRIQPDGRLDCQVSHETPTGWLFGEAALELSNKMLAHTHFADGRPTAGAMISVPFEFQAPE